MILLARQTSLFIVRQYYGIPAKPDRQIVPRPLSKMAILTSLYGGLNVLYSNLFVTLPIPEDAPGLSEQTIIVTGSNTGLGYETSQHLLRLGVGKLIMGVRNLDKGEKARAELLKATKRSPDTIEVWQVDSESYGSVKKFADRANNLPRLDAVLANAGILTNHFTLSEGNEKTITVNVISVFLLGLLLLPKLRSAPSAGRFVVPNSALHYIAHTKEIVPTKDETIFDRLNDPEQSDMANRYSLSKLLVLYVVRELAERTKLSGKGDVIFNTPNPSYCKSGLLNEPGNTVLPDFMARTTEMGSRAILNGVLAGPESNGHYLNNCHVSWYVI